MKERTLRLKLPFGQTLGLALILFSLLLSVSEVLTRTQVFKSHFIADARGTRHNQFELQLGRLPERHVGEIIIRSNSMLSEYYHRPDLTGQVIRNGWYYTSDMGYLAADQLYLFGRKKDIIIIGGKNIYPQDLEAIANQVPDIYPGRAVAFGSPDKKLGSEAIVMVCEVNHPTVTKPK